jgi:acetate---CoA ligase (ADP-forming)
VENKRRKNLRRLLSPRHVAFVGGKGLAEAIRQCIASGFSGPIWPVHPKYDELGGRPCLSSLSALPEAPDASFIGIPARTTIDVVRELAAMRAGGAVCHAAGFAEVGGEGVRLQQTLIEASGEMAIVGPNCWGLLNYLDGVALWPSGFGGGRTEKGAAIIAQSGNIALNLTMNQRSVPFSYVISAGNQAGLTIADYVDVLVEDPRVTAIGLYIEGLSDISGFSVSAAKALARNVPLVVLKAGRSALGARLGLSHTGSLCGEDRLYSALFERLGIVRVPSLGALLETLKLFSVARPPDGDRLVVFTCSGGDSLLAADAAAELEITLPEFNPVQTQSLRSQLPSFATVSNPLDYNTALWGNRAALTECFTTALTGDADMGLLVIDYPEGDADGSAACDASVDAIIAAQQRTGKPAAVASTLPELLPVQLRERLIAAGTPPLQGVEDAILALAGAASYATCRSRLLDGDPILSSSSLIPTAPQLLDEFDSKRRLARFGLKIPEGSLSAPADAAAIANRLGFPVVIKVAQPAMVHKSEAGAVALNLNTTSEVEAAVSAMAAALARSQPGMAVERFLIERQVSGAVAELLVGVKQDAQFGLALVIGAGGVLVELAGDTATLLLPASRTTVASALDGLRVSRLLSGYRGRLPGDREAVLDAVMAVAAFAEAHRDRLVELEINPLLVLPQGLGAVAADALIVMSEKQRT